jgi:hypothetical protein
VRNISPSRSTVLAIVMIRENRPWRLQSVSSLSGGIALFALALLLLAQLHSIAHRHEWWAAQWWRGCVVVNRVPWWGILFDQAGNLR